MTMVKSAMVWKDQEHPAVIVDSKGTVRVFDGEKEVTISFKDYEIAVASGKSPFSRVFGREHPPKPIMVPNRDSELLDL